MAAPPWSLSPAVLGLIFIVYLVGGSITPTAGRAIDRYGQRTVVSASAALTIAGALITLIPSIPAVLVGLTLASSGLRTGAVRALATSSPLMREEMR